MTEPVKPAPEGDPKPEEVKPEEGQKKVETIGEIINDDPKPDPEKPEPKVVPEAVFLELKKDNKELRRELKDLQQRVEGGATDHQVSSTVSSIAEKYDVDPKFLGELVTAIRKEADGETNTKISEALKPFQDKERAEKIQKVFDTHFDKAMGDMEDYKDIVNKNVIFALSLNPQNASKTIPQLIEETYGNALSGKRSIETTTPQRTSAPGTLDMDRANRDPEYLKEVLADPTLKKQYNEKAMEIARNA